MSRLVKTAFLSIDLFAYEPEEEEEKKPQKRKRASGSCCSLIIILAFAGYSIFKVVEFISNPSATSTPQISEVPANTSIPLPTIIFASPDRTFSDGFQNLIATGYVNYGNNLVQHFPLEICHPENLPDSLSNAVCYCPGMAGLSIPGTFEYSIVTTESLGITLYPRDCNVLNLNAPQAFFVAILNPFEIDFTAGKFVDTYIYSLVKTSLSGNLMMLATLPFQIEQYDISPDYLKRWKTHSRTKYSFQPLLTEFVVTPGCNTNAPLLTIQFVTHPTMITTSVAYLTILDLFANLGALWTTAFGVLAVVFLVFRRCEQKRLQKKRAERKKAQVAPDIAATNSPGEKLGESGIELKPHDLSTHQQRQDDTVDKDRSMDIKTDRDHCDVKML